jgi:hypothetical protein
MSSDMLLLVAALLLIVCLDVAALRFGADSRSAVWMKPGKDI